MSQATAIIPGHTVTKDSQYNETNLDEIFNSKEAGCWKIIRVGWDGGKAVLKINNEQLCISNYYCS